MASPKVWFIAGASRGFGRRWAKAALARGDKVAATARDLQSLEVLQKQYDKALLLLPLDVTDHDEVVRTVNRAHQHFGRLDVILSVADYGYMGAIEEVRRYLGNRALRDAGPINLPAMFHPRRSY